MQYAQVLEEIAQTLNKQPPLGRVANYIPELAKVSPRQWAMCLITTEDELFNQGQADTLFSLQSIAKVFSLTMAYQIMGEQLWQRVGVEPSGTPFNSLVQLEYEQGIPRNPFINSGALLVCDVLMEHLDNPRIELLEFIRQLAQDATVHYDIRVAQSEKAYGYRNRALIYLMKDFGNILNDPEEVLNLYFDLCSVTMNSQQLARSFLFFARHGQLPDHTCQLSASQARRINAIMQTCGFYDEAGEFTFKVGLPGKSGVGGGIAAIHPEKYAVAVWSPRLNSKGNSVLGLKALELLTSKLESSVF